MSRIFIAGTFVPFFLCAISSSEFSPPGCRPWSVRIRDIQHYRRLSRRLSEAAQPGGHGHGNHLHCSGNVTKTHLLPIADRIVCTMQCHYNSGREEIIG